MLKIKVAMNFCKYEYITRVCKNLLSRSRAAFGGSRTRPLCVSSACVPAFTMAACLPTWTRIEEGNICIYALDMAYCLG